MVVHMPRSRVKRMYDSTIQCGKKKEENREKNNKGGLKGIFLRSIVQPIDLPSIGTLALILKF